MKKHDDTLFQIGEVTKIMGITRKTLLVYEDMGLLTPAVKDEVSGYRYYTADNITHIKAIRALQMLGLSLKEVKEYYYDMENIDAHLNRLLELRASLDRNIEMLQVRTIRPGDFTIHRITLPKQVCFCRQYQCENVADAANKLRETYIAAARTNKMSIIHRMFTMRMSQPTEKLNLMCCIPVDNSFDGPERMEFDETPALCIYYRGPYEGLASAIKILMEYVQKNNLTVAGPFRSIYLEGPPNRGESKGEYITQVAVPISEAVPYPNKL